MKAELLRLLCCPDCTGELRLCERVDDEDEIRSGLLTCSLCRESFPIKEFIPRFVPTANYSGSFGFQWNRFRRTQLDSYSGHPISRARFLDQSGWKPEDLAGRLVLDGGCGSGRFAEIALDCGATVIAADYSSAVDACWKNLHERPGFHAVQGDIRRLPFREGCFDMVYSFGVLQHTPKPREAFEGLSRCLKAGGSIAVDIYRLSWKCLFMPKYWLRPITKRLPPPFLFELVERAVASFLPLSCALARLPFWGHRLRYLIPVANYEGLLPLDERQRTEWAVLDTFDMLSPTFDKPRTAGSVRRWFRDAGLQTTDVVKTYLAIVRARKPLSMRNAAEHPTEAAMARRGVVGSN